ncbi:MAG: hypothetical protein M3P98_01025 [bacterium]|nr:hypothetical protein [bacterium]
MKTATQQSTAVILRDIKCRGDETTDSTLVQAICLKSFASPSQVGDTVNDFNILGHAQAIETSLSVDVKHSDDDMIYLLNRIHCFVGNRLKQYQDKEMKRSHPNNVTNAFTSTKSIR